METKRQKKDRWNEGAPEKKAITYPHHLVIVDGFRNSGKEFCYSFDKHYTHNQRVLCNI